MHDQITNAVQDILRTCVTILLVAVYMDKSGSGGWAFAPSFWKRIRVVPAVELFLELFIFVA